MRGVWNVGRDRCSCVHCRRVGGAGRAGIEWVFAGQDRVVVFSWGVDDVVVIDVVIVEGGWVGVVKGEGLLGTSAKKSLLPTVLYTQIARTLIQPIDKNPYAIKIQMQRAPRIHHKSINIHRFVLAP